MSSVSDSRSPSKALEDLTPGQMRGLLAASLDLNSTLELDEVLRRVTDTACGIARAERATLYVLDRAASEVWTRAVSGPRIETIRLPVGHGLVGRAAETGRTSHLRDAYRSPHFDRSFDAANGFRTRAILTVPVRDRQRNVVGVLQAMNQRGRGWFSDGDRRALEVLGDTAALALENALAVQALRDKKKIDAQLEAARQIQSMLLPQEVATPEGYSLAARYLPCEAVGGDCYDVLDLEESGRTGFAVGDISGKGLTAAIMMANLMALLRVEARRSIAPDRVLTSMNRLFHDSTAPQYFATFFYGVLDAAAGDVRFATAGHEPPLVVRADGSVDDEILGDTLLATAGHEPPLVVRADGSVDDEILGDTLLGILPDVEFQPRHVVLDAGDVFVLCSDGVTEQADPKEKFFERAGLEKVIVAHRDETADAIAEAVLAAVRDFAKGTPPSDDLTLLVLKRVLDRPRGSRRHPAP